MRSGTVKSSIGMGMLLWSGIGDTIRVSLTEDPWCEIDPCQRLIAFAQKARDPACPPFSGQRPERPIQSFLPHRGGTVIVAPAVTRCCPAVDGSNVSITVIHSCA